MATPDFSRGNPFKPGSATIPDYVAGRKAERRLIDKAITEITKKRKGGILAESPMTHITLIGPRGAGKTTLLNLADKKATAKGVLVVRNYELHDLRSIIHKLIHRQVGWRRLVPRWLRRIGYFRVQVSEASLEIGLKEDPIEEDLELVLRERLANPVFLLLDEVMNYDLKSLASVLQVSQTLIEARLPLAVILAGTPDLEDHLGDTKASFIARSKDLRINLFTDDEAADALRTPLAGRGIEVDTGALEMMVDLADNYPFFIQMIGEEVWEILVERQKAIVDVATVEAASNAMQDARSNFYRKGYKELVRRELAPYARQVVDIVDSFPNKQAMQETIEAGLMSKNKGLSKNQAHVIVRKLQQRGFLWAYEDDLLGPGIPSFFTYVEQKKKVIAGERSLMSDDYHDLTEYPSEQTGDKGLQVKIELPKDAECGTHIQKEDFCIAGPEGKIFRVNRIEDTRENPLLPLEYFSGYILYLGAQDGDDFDDYGKQGFSQNHYWKNVASTR